MKREEGLETIQFQLPNDQQLVLSKKQQHHALCHEVARQVPGIGLSQVRFFLFQAGVHASVPYRQLTKDQFVHFWKGIQGHAPCYRFQHWYRRWWIRLQKTESNRYRRIQQGLPSWGQRTRSNARTAKKVQTLFLRWTKR